MPKSPLVATLVAVALAAAGSLVVGGSAQAQTVDCKNPQDQMSMNICADRTYRTADVRLNATYRALAAKVSPAGKTKLQSAQRAWLTYRDAQCAFETAGTADGSIHPMIVLGCLEGLTLAQTKLLSQQLHCQEGDLSCGGQ